MDHHQVRKAREKKGQTYYLVLGMVKMVKVVKVVKVVEGPVPQQYEQQKYLKKLINLSLNIFIIYNILKYIKILNLI
jgi:hypothetical protein